MVYSVFSRLVSVGFMCSTVVLDYQQIHVDDSEKQLFVYLGLQLKFQP
jgi:hypothetical protein